MADTRDSKSLDRKVMRVRLSPRAHRSTSHSLIEFLKSIRRRESNFFNIKISEKFLAVWDGIQIILGVNAVN